MRTIRMTWAGTINNPITINGHSYSDNGTGFADLPYEDAMIAETNGWSVMGIIGTTAQRPLPTDSQWRGGMKYVDITLDKIITFGHDGLWHDAITGAAV